MIIWQTQLTMHSVADSQCSIVYLAHACIANKRLYIQTVCILKIAEDVAIPHQELPYNKASSVCLCVFPNSNRAQYVGLSLLMTRAAGDDATKMSSLPGHTIRFKRTFQYCITSFIASNSGTQCAKSAQGRKLQGLVINTKEGDCLLSQH